MTFDSDIFLDRTKLKKQLNIWRALALFIVVACFWLYITNNSLISRGRDHIVRVNIEDVIVEDLKYEKILEKIASNDSVKAVILYINSPGGTEVGSEIIYQSLRDIAKKKPLVSIMGTIAASGGYMVALAADYIFARHGTATGSIGVVMQSYDLTNFADKLGIKFHSFKSGALKAVPSPFEPVTPEINQAVQSLITDNYNFFVALVAERRKIPLNKVLEIADGRIVTGNQAKELNLIDAIGGEREALSWIREKHNLVTDLPIKEINFKKQNFWTDNLLSLANSAKLYIELNSQMLHHIIPSFIY